MLDFTGWPRYNKDVFGATMVRTLLPASARLVVRRVLFSRYVHTLITKFTILSSRDSRRDVGTTVERAP